MLFVKMFKDGHMVDAVNLPDKTKEFDVHVQPASSLNLSHQMKLFPKSGKGPIKNICKGEAKLSLSHASRRMKFLTASSCQVTIAEGFLLAPGVKLAACDPPSG